MNKKVKKLFALFMLMFFIPAALFSLDKKIAFLESGPHVYTGMPGIGINAIQGYSGIYELPVEENSNAGQTETDAEKSGKTATVYFTKNVLPVFESWKVVRTSPQIIYQTSGSNVFIYRHFSSWTIFCDFSDTTLSESEILSFVDALVRQMIFFVKSGDDFLGASFPAVIEY